MGVKGLWKMLECTGRPINPETLEGKILAIDISIWLNQAVKGVRDRQGNAVQNAHLLALFHRLCKLLFFRIKPVFVFDGDAPLLKKQTLAKRRQRKEVAASDSKKTTEKLLKTFLKRQAIKTALTGESSEPMLSLSQVQREVDDIYVLPSLEEREKNSSEEEDDKEWEERMTQKRLLQEEFFEDPHSVDIESEDFSCLPPEVKHEILTDMKEFTKRRRTLFEPMPEESNDFSQYQLKGLLKKNSLNMHIRSVQREMNEQSSGEVQTQYEHEGGFMKDMETRRLVSEDASHYILIKGIKAKKEEVEETAAESLPSKSLGRSKCAEILSKTHAAEKLSWAEEERAMDAAPPSPRTLLAIQAAMLESSSEEEEAEKESLKFSLNLDSPQPSTGGADDGLSPKTLRGVQQALNEEDKNDNGSHEPVIQGVEMESARKRLLLVNTLDEDEKGHKFREEQELLQPCLQSANPRFTQKFEAGQKTTILEKVIVPDEKCRANVTDDLPALERRDVDSTWCCASGNSDNSLSENIISEAKVDTGARSKSSDSSRDTPPSSSTCIDPSVLAGTGESERVQARSSRTKAEPLTLEHVIPGGTGDSEIAMKAESSDLEEDDDSDGSFIEVEADTTCAPWFHSETEKPSQATYEGEITAAPAKGGPTVEMDSVSSDADAAIKNSTEDIEQRQAAGKERDAIVNEWQDINVEELENLESALSVQQTTLQAEKQQQERMAASVTGQMCLESQELLRLFGIPYIVSPMEAEAQCALLDLTDQTAGTITDDSDVWLFGARHVYKNFYSQNKYVEYYRSADIRNQLGLDRNKLINLAYLVGSDYTEGIPTVGCVTAMEILNEFPGPGMEPLIKFTTWWTESQERQKAKPNPNDTKVKKKLCKLELYPGFPNMAVAEAYLKPVVDNSHGTFYWGRPDLEQIREFCESRFGWYRSRTDEVLLPVLRQLNACQVPEREDWVLTAVVRTELERRLQEEQIEDLKKSWDLCLKH
ncbi:DNA repair protein complementing XP-G cells isoform X2 [Rhinatrema bivittatum]|uniref:DNA repair protein complementing XP-G cells isoform X2 n=1 Tax=Rhinatrema bivittatum TaxID=194408 RepID=UPI00112C0A0C|nr:DNA repair protein complementing XP-G cells isoform X2 [Rhinatrema bivittatum]